MQKEAAPYRRDLTLDFNKLFLLLFSLVGFWFALRPEIMGHQPAYRLILEWLTYWLVIIIAMRLPVPMAVPGLIVTTVLSALVFLAIASYTDLRTYEFEEYWGGFGIKRAALCFIVALATITIQTARLHNKRFLQKKRYRTGLLITLRVCGAAVAFLLVPSVIQPLDGWLNVGDGTQYVLEDLAAWVAGNLPGIHIAATYQSLLGAPLLLLRAVDLRSDQKIVAIALYANFLALCVPILVTHILRRIYPKVPVVFAFACAIATITVSGYKWNTSLVQELSPVTRLVLPLALCSCVVLLLARDQGASGISCLILGFLGSIAAVNNLEYGAPALGAALMSLVLFCAGVKEFLSRLVIFVLGAILFVGLVLVGSWLLNPGFLQFRLGLWKDVLASGASAEEFRGQFAYPSPLSMVPLLIALSMSCLALIPKFRGNSSRLRTERLSAIVSVYLSFWIIFGIPHCLNLSCGRGGHSTQMFITPLFLLGVAVARLTSADVLKDESDARWHDTFRRKLGHLPAYMIAALGLVAVTQAPSALDEWNRVQIPQTVKHHLDEWSYRQFDFIDVNSVAKLADQYGGISEVGYFGLFGNAVEIATGLENLVGTTGLLGYPNSVECIPLVASSKQLVIGHVGIESVLRRCRVPYFIEYHSTSTYLEVYRILRSSN